MGGEYHLSKNRIFLGRANYVTLQKYLALQFLYSSESAFCNEETYRKALPRSPCQAKKIVHTSIYLASLRDLDQACVPI